MTKRLTTKQQRFVDIYDGNATEAAKSAGYKHPRQTGCRLLKKVNILAAIREREIDRDSQAIMDREKRQAFWTRIMLGEETHEVVIGKGDNRQVVEIGPSMSDRLRASELLGKSEGDFLERKREEGELIVKIVKFGQNVELPAENGINEATTKTAIYATAAAIESGDTVTTSSKPEDKVEYEQDKDGLVIRKFG